MNADKKRHPFLKTFSIILLLLVLAGIALAVLLPSRLTNFAGSKGSSLTGREFAVEDIAIDWNWKTPTVHVRNLTLSNVEGSEEPQMLSIEAADFQIRIWRLLTGELNLPSLSLTKPKIVLEKNADGAKNWEFPAFSQSNAAAETALPDERGNFPIIGKLTVTDGALLYIDKTKDLRLDLGIETATGDASDEQGQFRLSGNGSLQKKVFKIDATGGSLRDLRDSDQDFPLDLDLTMGGTRIKANGTFKDPVKLEGVNTDFTITGDNMADLFYLTGIPLPPTPSYSLKGNIEKNGEFWFSEFQGKVGKSDLSGTIGHDSSGERGYTKGELTSNLLDIQDIGGFIGVRPGEETKKEASGRALPDVPLNLTRLRAADLDISLDAKRINAPGPVERANVRFLLKNGVLTLNPMDLGVAGGIVDGELVLNGHDDTPKVTMDLSLRKLKLRPFFSDTRFESFSAGTFGGKIKLAGRGKSLADVLATSDGHVMLGMAGGQISLIIIEAAGIDIGELTPLILGEDKNTSIRCAIGDFDVKNGLLTSNIFVFDTTDTNIQGDAKINLKNEAMDIRLDANPKDASLLTLRTPITVGGTMKKPQIGIDPGELAARGAGAAILGVVAPFIAIIPFIELGLGEDSDCRHLIAKARENSAESNPKP
jgi:uncharacterized protein involved in outer membrane biogenesis